MHKENLFEVEHHNMPENKATEELMFLVQTIAEQALRIKNHKLGER